MKLTDRFWTIYDSLNGTEIVSGEGVVGQTPTLLPDDNYTYKSGCFLESKMGAMKGYYTMKNIETFEEFKGITATFHTCDTNLIKLKKIKNKVPKIKDPACLNCGHPFYGQEKFCPDCGQANKANSITFKSFIQEVFNGFISWDSKFWTTFIPLLTKPGKVSRDYIDGKRQRYANPFRFYLTISVLFFLIIGATESYDTFKELRTGKTASEKSINDQKDDAVPNKQ